MNAIATPPRLATDAAWNDYIVQLPLAHALQTAQWADLKCAYGWQQHRLSLDGTAGPRAAALLLTRRLPIPGRSIAYVPRGPLAAPDDPEAWSLIADQIRRTATACGSIFVKIDPDLTGSDSAAVAALAAAGFQPSDDQIQYRNTLLIDVSRSDDELRGAMRREARNYLNRSRRAGVVIREGGLNDLDLFHAMYAETARRQHFLLRPPDYYQHAWRAFIEAGLGAVFIAEVDGQAISGAIIYRFGDRAWYLYGASTERHREARPNEALQWHIMRWARDQRITTYDLWGAPNILRPGEPMAGVVQFKRSLGGVPHRWIGAWDMVLDPLLYRAWTRWVPSGLHLGRRILRLPEAAPADS